MSLKGVIFIRYKEVPDLLVINLEFEDHDIYNFISLN